MKMKKQLLIIIIAIILCISGISGCFEKKTQNTNKNDIDGDGLTNEQETILGSNISNPDTDNDKIYDFFETNNSEAIDSDGDKIIDVLDNDDDNDSILTNNENPDPNNDGNPNDALDTDEDGISNYLDSDDDNDGILTIIEVTYSALYSDDVDEDGLLNYLDKDSDNDSKLDGEEGTGDIDGDGFPNFLDSNDSNGPLGDLDNDGLTNEEENYSDTNPPDIDGDGLPDYLDPDSDGGSSGSNSEQDKFIGSWHNIDNEGENWIFYKNNTQKFMLIVTDNPPGETYVAVLWFDYTIDNGTLCQLPFTSYGGVPSCYGYEFSENDKILTLFDEGTWMLSLGKDEV
jgi:hypothetical protein